MAVPVRLPDDSIYGTLCGASESPAHTDESLLALMQLFARVIADQIVRERRLEESRDRAARAERRIRERAEFLARAEHMLKTPLAIVSGWAQTLQRGLELDPEFENKAIGMIATHARRLREQVDALLNAARNDVLTADLEIVPLDARTELAAAAEAFGRVSSDHLVVLDEATPALPVMADAAALHQILCHLIDNAIKYSPGGGTITLRGQTDGTTVRLHVDDEGLGLPEGIDVFEPFVRGEQSEAGVGLGLHIVRELAEAMNGKPRALGLAKGTRFTVELPARAAPPRG